MEYRMPELLWDRSPKKIMLLGFSFSFFLSFLFSFSSDFVLQ